MKAHKFRFYYYSRPHDELRVKEVDNEEKFVQEMDRCRKNPKQRFESTHIDITLSYEEFIQVQQLLNK